MRNGRRVPIGVTLILSGVMAPPPAFSQGVESGRQTFVSRCAGCHGTDGNGGELGPPIAGRVPLRTDSDLAELVRDGRPAAGMPPSPVAGANDVANLIAFLRTLTPRSGARTERRTLALEGGQTLTGLVMNETRADAQVLGDDRQIHLLRATDGSRWREVTSQTDWAAYDGETRGYRYSPLAKIDTRNVGRLAPVWSFTLPNTARLQVTPVVVTGVMYVTVANECYALDAGSGREIWHYQRPRTKGLIGNAAGGINRGVAVAGNRVFMVTDHAHIIALDRHTGALLWETEMADWRQNYNATGAPLVVGDSVIVGTSGGDEGVRGFLAAFDQTTGAERWRFWTVPAPGEPKSDTWQGPGIAHPAGAAWMTGAYDPALDTLYWAVGNPGPDLIGDDRPGDNLYTDSVVALDPRTGRLKWHFQFTPHDVWDYDAQEPLALIDAPWEGRPRQLLIQANRNGFFYVLDRTTGTFLFGRPYVSRLTWASGLDANGRPRRLPDTEPTAEGRRGCPSLDGASNWYSTAFSPMTGLYYVQVNEKCGIFTRTPSPWEAGKGYMGGSARQAPDEPAQRILRAFDIRTARPVWELPQSGAVNSWGGVLATGGGLVFFGEDSGAFMAADARSGAPLWRFQTSQLWKASPMTYEFDGRQHVAIAAGPNILSFGIVDLR